MRRLLLALLAALVSPASAAADVRDEILIQRAPGLSAAARADVRADANVTLERTLPGLPRVELLQAPEGERAEALRALEADPDVEWAEPNQPVHTAAGAATEFRAPAPEWAHNLWGVFAQTDIDTDADEAWDVARGDGVTVGVADTGVDGSHPDLAGQLMPGRNFVSFDSTAGDPGHTGDVHGHGTHVAGTIAAAENGSGVVGVAPDAKIMPLRVLPDTGSGSTADVAAGFAWAGAQGVEIVNASLGSTAYSEALRVAIAEHPDTLYVVAAGNNAWNIDGADGGYPCELPEPNVLCVGAIGREGNQSSFSNHGATAVDLHAPGESILSSYTLGRHATMSGTSMASPHAAGAAALVLAHDPQATAAQIKAALMSSVDAAGSLSGLSVTGGRLNAARALGITELDADGRAPRTPANFTVTPQVEAVDLDWDASPEPDLVEYRVWRYDYALSKWALVTATTATQARVGDHPAGQWQLLQVTAHDARYDSAPTSALGTAALHRPWQPTPGTPTPGNPNTPANPTPSNPAPSDPAPSNPSPANPVPSNPTVPTPTPTPEAKPTPAPASARVQELRVQGARSVSFTLSAPASVSITLQRKVGTRYRAVSSRTLRLKAGAQRLDLRRALGLRGRAGTWRVETRTPAGTARASFRVG